MKSDFRTAMLRPFRQLPGGKINEVLWCTKKWGLKWGSRGQERSIEGDLEGCEWHS